MIVLIMRILGLGLFLFFFDSPSLNWSCWWERKVKNINKNPLPPITNNNIEEPKPLADDSQIKVLTEENNNQVLLVSEEKNLSEEKIAAQEKMVKEPTSNNSIEIDDGCKVSSTTE